MNDKQSGNEWMNKIRLNIIKKNQIKSNEMVIHSGQAVWKLMDKRK